MWIGIWWRPILAILAAVLLLAGETFAQSSQASVKRVGVAFFRVSVSDLSGNPPKNASARYFHQGLRDLGWVEGKNLEILWRSAEGDQQRAAANVHELAASKVDVLVLLSGGQSAFEAAKTVRTVPIVFVRAGTLEGHIASMARPGGNVTGLLDAPDGMLTGKRLEILKQAVPGASRIALLLDDPRRPGAAAHEADLQSAAARLGVTLMPYPVNTAAQLHATVADAHKKGAQALLVDTSFGAAGHEEDAYRVVAERHRLPALFRFPGIVASGAGLFNYGLDSAEYYRRAAVYVDKILRGASPATLAVEQPMTLRLTINLKAAKAIGFTFPSALLARADEVLE